MGVSCSKSNTKSNQQRCSAVPSKKTLDNANMPTTAVVVINQCCNSSTQQQDCQYQALGDQIDNQHIPRKHYEMCAQDSVRYDARAHELTDVQARNKPNASKICNKENLIGSQQAYDSIQQTLVLMYNDTSQQRIRNNILSSSSSFDSEEQQKKLFSERLDSTYIYGMNACVQTSRSPVSSVTQADSVERSKTRLVPTPEQRPSPGINPYYSSYQQQNTGINGQYYEVASRRRNPIMIVPKSSVLQKLGAKKDETWCLNLSLRQSEDYDHLVYSINSSCGQLFQDPSLDSVPESTPLVISPKTQPVSILLQKEIEKNSDYFQCKKSISNCIFCLKESVLQKYEEVCGTSDPNHSSKVELWLQRNDNNFEETRESQEFVDCLNTLTISS